MTTASLVDVFGVPPLLGRWYTEQEDSSAARSWSCCRTTSGPRQFNGDPAIIGRG